MGDPDFKSKAELWGGDGEYHQEWKYTRKGIILDFIVQKDNSGVLNMITISQPCELKTKRLIGIGGSLVDVKKAYYNVIDSASSDDKVIIAGTVYGGLIFSIENNVVKSIFIGANAE